MTNEEILRRTQAVYDNIGPDFGHDLAAFARDLVLQTIGTALQLEPEFSGQSGVPERDAGYYDGFQAGVAAYKEMLQCLKDGLSEELSA